MDYKIRIVKQVEYIAGEKINVFSVQRGVVEYEDRICGTNYVKM